MYVEYGCETHNETHSSSFEECWNSDWIPRIVFHILLLHNKWPNRINAQAYLWEKTPPRVVNCVASLSASHFYVLCIFSTSHPQTTRVNPTANDMLIVWTVGTLMRRRWTHMATRAVQWPPPPSLRPPHNLHAAHAKGRLCNSGLLASALVA